MHDGHPELWPPLSMTAGQAGALQLHCVSLPLSHEEGFIGLVILLS